MIRVGLTGGIASGKSLVAAELGRLGAVVIDADVLAREVVEPGTPGLAHPTSPRQQPPGQPYPPQQYPPER